MKKLQELESYQKVELSTINKEIVNVRQVQSEEFMQFKIDVAQDISSKFRDVSNRLESVQTGATTNMASIFELVKELKNEMDTG